jgi:uncharacterized membrane protein YcaP (DUF421 family)
VAISIIRTLILYIVMVASMRIMGKRQLGELEPAELVVAVLISDLAANPLQDIGTPLIYGLAPVITLLFCEVMLSAAVLRSRKLRLIIAGSPSAIIQNGKLDRAEMRKSRYTTDELMERLRKEGIADISAVKLAVLETDGTLSVVLFAERAPLTAKSLSVTIEEPDVPGVIISDGEIIAPTLRALGFDDRWLAARLRERGISAAGDVVNAAREVFLMTADRGGKIYLAAKDKAANDKITNG